MGDDCLEVGLREGVSGRYSPGNGSTKGMSTGQSEGWQEMACAECVCLNRESWSLEMLLPWPLSRGKFPREDKASKIINRQTG